MQVNQIKNVNKQPFKSIGLTGALVQTFDTIARGGMAGSFLTQDVLACGAPRTVSSLKRNKEVTGKNNYVAATETAIREGLTGTSMFFIPALVLGIGRKVVGKANNVPLKTIEDLSAIMEQTLNSNPALSGDNLRQAFYTNVFEKLAQNGDIAPDDIGKFTQDLLQIEKAPKRNFFKTMFNKPLKKGSNELAKDQLLDKFSEFFMSVKKKQHNNYDINFNAAKLSEGNEINVGKLTKHLKNYADDFLSKARSAADVTNFKNLRTGARFITNIAVTVLTGLFLTNLPKLYSISKTNPEAVVQKGGEEHGKECEKCK